MIIIIILSVNVSLSLTNLSAADAPEDTVLISEDRAAFYRRTRTSEGTADRDTCEDAAASPEKEKLLKKENGTEDRASD